MTADELMTFLFRDSRHKPSAPLKGLLQDCPKFSDFVELNRNKIRKKIRCASKLGDVLAELRVACLLLSDVRVDVEYEKYGSTIRAPDLTATFMRSVEFNVEVARIRAGEINKRYDKWCHDLRDRVGVEVPTVDWDIRLDKDKASLELIGKLERCIGRIAQFVIVKIQEKARRLATATTTEYPVKGFPGTLTLVVSVDPLGLRQRGGRCVSSRSIPYTKDEKLKFRDIVVDKLGQTRPGMINVIFVICQDERYDPPDLLWGMGSLHRALTDGDGMLVKKVLRKFKTMEEFKARLPELSAVVLRSDWRAPGEPNSLCHNPCARNRIPEALCRCLIRIDHALA